MLVLASLRDSGLPSDLPDGRAVENPVQSPLQKYFASPVGQIISTNSRIPSRKRGVSRSSRTLERDAVDAAAFGARWDRRAGSQESVSDHRRADERRFSRTAKSCGPDTATLVSSWRNGMSAQPGADKLPIR